MMFSREDYEFLKQYEKSFDTAKRGYVRGLLSRDRREIKDRYDNTFHRKYHYSDTCPNCVLTLMKNVGKEYYEAKKVYEEPEPIAYEIPENIVNELVIEEPIKKKNKKDTKKKHNELQDSETAGTESV